MKFKEWADWSYVLVACSLPLVLTCAEPDDGGPGDGGVGGPPVLSVVEPARQRVHDYIMLRGQNLGNTVGQVRFIIPPFTIPPDEKVPEQIFSVRKVYVWRNRLVQVRVPVGFLRNGVTPTKLPAEEIGVQLIREDGEETAIRTFELIRRSPGDLAQGPVPSFVQLTEILNGHEVSNFLGSDQFNFARTKDAEVGDLNGDGLPDILDNNSWNVDNGSHNVLHLNNGDGSFSQRCLDPLSPADTGCNGDFAVTLPEEAAAADFFGDSVTYDADFADVDQDGDLDIIQTAASAEVNRVRILENSIVDPGNFLDSTALFLPDGIAEFPTGSQELSPDDLDHIDFTRDGRVDFVVTGRKTGPFAAASQTKLLVHGVGEDVAYELLQTLIADEMSTHDAFFLFANNDHWPDIFLCNELGFPARSHLYLHPGGDQEYPSEPSQEFNFTAPDDNNLGAEAGFAADFNSDGLDDFVLVGRGLAKVYLNTRNAPGNFEEVTLPNPSPDTFYDVEVGDIDLDGDVDVIAVATPGGNATPEAGNTVRVWLNNGNGTAWFASTTTSLLPGIAPVQRISADLIDFDNDGDLDLYLTGPDQQLIDCQGTGRPDGCGRGANQFFENRTIQ